MQNKRSIVSTKVYHHGPYNKSMASIILDQVIGHLFSDGRDNQFILEDGELFFKTKKRNLSAILRDFFRT